MIKLDKIMNDKRYTINKEWCGHIEKKHVARFCGEWIGKGETYNKAALLCIFHQDERQHKILM